MHGPVPRKYDYALPKKMILGALRSALSAKLAEQKLTVVDGWKLDSHKTKPFRQALGKLHKEQKTCLIVEAGENVNLERASRNIAGVTLVPPTALEPYDLLRHDALVMLSREAVAKLNRALSATTPEVPVQIEAAPAAKNEAPEAARTRKPAKAEDKKDAGEEAGGEERNQGQVQAQSEEGLSDGEQGLSRSSGARSSPKRASA